VHWSGTSAQADGSRPVAETNCDRESVVAALNGARDMTIDYWPETALTASNGRRVGKSRKIRLIVIAQFIYSAYCRVPMKGKCRILWTQVTETHFAARRINCVGAPFTMATWLPVCHVGVWRFVSDS